MRQGMSEGHAIEKLLHTEARLLDEGRYVEWLELYTEDCEYWVPASPRQESPRGHVSLFYEDRTLMETRVKRLGHSHAHSLALPVRMSRILGGIEVERAEGLEVLADCSFHLVEYHNGRQRFFAGRYRHRLRETEAGVKIVSKRVDLIDCDAAHEVIQLFL
jgi:ethylbenzene dioxygenase subunit beta